MATIPTKVRIVDTLYETDGEFYFEEKGVRKPIDEATLSDISHYISHLDHQSITIGDMIVLASDVKFDTVIDLSRPGF